jgi:hypothetical protein
MNTKYISKIFTAAIFSGLVMLGLFGISASNVVAQKLTVDKAVCDNVGERDTCNGANESLAGQTIEFSVTNITADPVVTQVSIFVTINQGNDGKSTSGTTTVDSDFPAGTSVRVCEVDVPIGFDSIPRPGDSTGGQQTTGGPGFEDCIIATIGPGNNVFKFINDKIELEPTAATAMVAGRVMVDTGFARGNGILLVTILNTRTSETQVAFTNRLGYYEFNDLPVGDTYVVSVRGKGYNFTPQVISLSEDRSLDMRGIAVENSRSKGMRRNF